MNKDRLELAIFVILLCALGYVAIVILQAATEIIVSVLSAVGALLVSIFKYSSDRIREQEMAALGVKRANYQKLLEAIGSFAQNYESKHDLMVAHTESWAFAEAVVVENTSKFIDSPSQKNLKNLLVSMRSDIGLSALEDIESLVKNLYPQEEKKAGFPSS